MHRKGGYASGNAINKSSGSDNGRGNHDGGGTGNCKVNGKK